jgi:hypothetical protein
VRERRERGGGGVGQRLALGAAGGVGGEVGEAALSHQQHVTVVILDGVMTGVAVSQPRLLVNPRMG